MGAGLGLSTLGILLRNTVNDPTPQDIASLNAADIFSFDRGATNNFSSSAQKISDAILYTGATLPFIMYFNHRCRAQEASVALMGIETILITNGLTNIAKASFKRFRPFTYNEDVPNELKLESGARLSFFSGHASNTAAMFFFSAKVLTEIHPDMKNKYLVWTAAATIPAAISYFRYKAGKHFPTDVITGYAVGAAVGYLIPTIHLNGNVHIHPGVGGGLSLQVNLK